jgi:hypothetical protein
VQVLSGTVVKSRNAPDVENTAQVEGCQAGAVQYFCISKSGQRTGAHTTWYTATALPYFRPMSTVTIDPPKKQSRSKPKEKRQGQSKINGAERLKTVVRRLPPNLPESIFWQSVQTWVTDDSVLWKEYWPGKVKKK